MTNPTIDSTGPPPPPPSRSRWLLSALGGVAALVLIIGFLVWSGTRDDDVTSPPTTVTPSTSPAPTSTIEVATTLPSTTAPETTTVATSAPVATTTPVTPPPTTVPPTTPPTTVPSPPSGPTWTVVPRGFPDRTLTLDRVVEVDGAAAYEGVLDLGANALRCVVVAFDGSWSELCTEPDRTATFVAIDGLDPWMVEVGTATGDITMVRRAPTRTLPTNGCDVPLATLIPADTIGGSVLTSIRCVPGDAVMGFAHAILGPGPPDGLIVVAAEGDEGWNVVDLGTEIDCASSDGVDRCALYGVEEYLTGGLPVPPTAFPPTSPDIVSITDVTSTVRGWTGAETDPQSIIDLISDQVVDPDDALEAPPTEYRVDLAGLTLVVMVVPQLDDSVRSVTYAAWVAPAGSPPIVLATTWATCARGIAGPGLCL